MKRPLPKKWFFLLLWFSGFCLATILIWTAMLLEQYVHPNKINALLERTGAWQWHNYFSPEGFTVFYFRFGYLWLTIIGTITLAIALLVTRIYFSEK